MQTFIPSSQRYQGVGQTEIGEAEAILRACVHCGFCTATCPTYQITGDELDSPRGRIYLIKALLEGEAATEKTRLHLDRCLTCRSCEITCPSGVRYHRLVDIGRRVMEEKAPRRQGEQLLRNAALKVLPDTHRLGLAFKAGRILRPLLPQPLKQVLPPSTTPLPWPRARRARYMLVLEGCAQPHAAPNTNAAAARVLDRLGISLLRAEQAGCCGAINQHLSDSVNARQLMRNNIDAWWPLLEKGAEAIVMTASACGLTIKEYGDELRDDPLYAAKAARVSELARDISEIIRQEDLAGLALAGQGRRVAFHSSCTLQNGQKLGGVVEGILQRCGYELVPVADGHLCCGAAGTYMLTQPALSQQLRTKKLGVLTAAEPDVIATANVGCQMQLVGGTTIPVKHWIELLDSDTEIAASVG